jgi:LysM repeat protein
LESIAKEYGVTVDDIVKENHGVTNDNLKPGQMLTFQGYDIEM